MLKVTKIAITHLVTIKKEKKANWQKQTSSLQVFRMLSELWIRIYHTNIKWL